MTVEAADRGLRVLTVYEGSPADRGGLEPRRRHHATSTGRSIAGRARSESTTQIKGPAGTTVKLDRALGRQGART